MINVISKIYLPWKVEGIVTDKILQILKSPEIVAHKVANAAMDNNPDDN